MQWISLLENSARVARAPELDDIVNDLLHRLLVPLPERIVHHLLPWVRAPVEAGLELSEEAPLLAQAPAHRDGRRGAERRSDVAILVARCLRRHGTGVRTARPRLMRVCTVYVQCVGPWRHAAMNLWYARHAGGRYAWSVRAYVQHGGPGRCVSAQRGA